MGATLMDAPGSAAGGSSVLTLQSARFPLEALRAHVGCSWRALQTLMRVNGGVLEQFRRRGLDTYQADRYAQRCGEFHPAEIWPEWTFVVVEDADGDEILACA